MKFHLCQNDRYETHTVLSFISFQFMGTQVKSWLNTEVRFSTEMKSHTGLSSFCLSCERNLRNEILFNFSLHVGSQRNTLEVQRLPGDILQKTFPGKVRKIHRKKHVLEYFYKTNLEAVGLQLYQKDNAARVFSCEFIRRVFCKKTC